MGLTIGMTAPDFTLYNSEKNKVTLSDLKDQNVLLLFFPLAFTSVCTTELCHMRDNLGMYNSLNVKIIGISVDSVYTLAKFKEEQHLNFDLVSDFNKEVSLAYDSLYETFGLGMKGVGKRSAFIINRLGKVEYAEVLENASEVPDFQKINDVLNVII